MNPSHSSVPGHSHLGAPATIHVDPAHAEARPDASRRRKSSSEDTGSPPSASTDASLAFVKGSKRKRLSKACDACHKSKRRCDGTAPCGNCYFASKKCTYTDSSGRTVPAPRNLHPERTRAAADAPAQEYADSEHEHGRRRVRGDNSGGPSGAPAPQPPLDAAREAPSQLLDPATTFELVNVFFAHCNPHRLILHKPSFSAALAQNQVAEYLLLAVCATAAPLSRTYGGRTAGARQAGVPFYNEACAIMFRDGQLRAPKCLATAQALTLLEMHEVAASHSWARSNHYFELALAMLDEDLGVHRADHEALAARGGPSGECLNAFIERECVRRCFWMIQCMGWISGIYIYKPIAARSVELMPHVRLPVDETTFELTVHSHSATEEYLHVPAPCTRYASEFGHLCRILAIYQGLQQSIATTTPDSPARTVSVADSRRQLEAWLMTLPGHLRFSEETLDTQLAMFETGSNSGAWLFCFVHSLHCCCFLAVLEGEGTLTAPIPWVRNELNMIINTTAHRMKNTIMLACVLWSYSRYHPEDPQVHAWDREFEKVWGFRVMQVADQWRQAQAIEAANRHRESAIADSAAASGARISPESSARVLDESVQYTATLVESTRLQRAQALPSLKASGLLDSWKPPSEAFASSLSLAGGAPPEKAGERRASVGGARAPAVPGNMPVGLTWLNNET